VNNHIASRDVFAGNAMSRRSVVSTVHPSMARPALAVADDGRAIAAWQGSDDVVDRLQGAFRTP
jgi:hypothetical protein